MRKINLVKTVIVVIVVTIGFVGFLFTRTSEMQTVNPVKAPENIFDGVSEVTGYKNWTKVNDTPQIMASRIAMMCARATQEQSEADATNPHKNKYVNVFVNSIGKDEMLTRKNPIFPVGTVVVKEKLSSPESQSPELLTVMIKREKGFNPEVGDWEFMTLNGDASKVTSRGKLQNCQTCHLDYEQNNYITRKYLSENIRKKLK